MFSGVHTAIITPLRDGAIDYESLTALIERQIEGRERDVPCGTTGESATMRDEEIVMSSDIPSKLLLVAASLRRVSVR